MTARSSAYSAAWGSSRRTCSADTSSLSPTARLCLVFSSQNLSSKIQRWFPRLTQFHIDVQWRNGADHTAPDAMSRLRHKGPPQPLIEKSFPDDTTCPVDHSGRSGPVLGDVEFRSLVPLAAGNGDPPPFLSDSEDTRPAKDDEPVLDGIRLATLGPLRCVATRG